MSDAWDHAFIEAGYAYCRPCAEWHRPPECWIDERGVPALDLPAVPTCPTRTPEVHLLGEFPMTCYRCRTGTFEGVILVDAETLAVHLGISRSEVYRRVRQNRIRIADTRRNRNGSQTWLFDIETLDTPESTMLDTRP